MKYAFHVKKRILQLKNKFFTKNILGVRWNATFGSNGILESNTS